MHADGGQHSAGDAGNSGFEAGPDEGDYRGCRRQDQPDPEQAPF
jgi:hypothetical protein